MPKSGRFLEGKHALVTGGSRGIGLAIARALAVSGARVSVLSRSAPDTGDTFFRVQADVGESDAVSHAVSQCREANGPVAILINNAGIAASAPFLRTGKAMWDRIIGTNLTGTYSCSREVIAEMRDAKWGRIVNVASIAALSGAPYISAYTASKHGVLGLTRSLAAEFVGTGVTCNAVCPGYTETDMMRDALRTIVSKTGVSLETARTQLAQTNPGNRIVAVEEVAAAVIALCCSDDNGSEIILPR